MPRVRVFVVVMNDLRSWNVFALGEGDCKQPTVRLRHVWSVSQWFFSISGMIVWFTYMPIKERSPLSNIPHALAIWFQSTSPAPDHVFSPCGVL
jgi:hypothetical protein